MKPKRPHVMPHLTARAERGSGSRLVEGIKPSPFAFWFLILPFSFCDRLFPFHSLAALPDPSLLVFFSSYLYWVWGSSIVDFISVPSPELLLLLVTFPAPPPVLKP